MRNSAHLLRRLNETSTHVAQVPAGQGSAAVPGLPKCKELAGMLGIGG
jgi:hypothetical protein